MNRKSSTIIQSNDQIDHLNSSKNIEELRKIVSNQNKYIQQLQIHVRLNTPNVIQTPTSDKLIEENRVNISKRKFLKLFFFR